MIGIKSDPVIPVAVVECRFGQVKVLFGSVDEGVGSGVVVALCRGFQVNFGVVVGTVGVVVLGFDVMFVGPETVVVT